MARTSGTTAALTGERQRQSQASVRDTMAVMWCSWSNGVQPGANQSPRYTRSLTWEMLGWKGSMPLIGFGTGAAELAELADAESAPGDMGAITGCGRNTTSLSVLWQRWEVLGSSAPRCCTEATQGRQSLTKRRKGSLGMCGLLVGRMAVGWLAARMVGKLKLLGESGC